MDQLFPHATVDTTEEWERRVQSKTKLDEEQSGEKGVQPEYRRKGVQTKSLDGREFRQRVSTKGSSAETYFSRNMLQSEHDFIRRSRVYSKQASSSRVNLKGSPIETEPSPCSTAKVDSERGRLHQDIATRSTRVAKAQEARRVRARSTRQRSRCEGEQ